MWAPERIRNPPKTRAEAVADVIVTGAVPMLGVIAGIISLFGIRRHGSAGILWKAVSGLAIFLLMILAAIPSVLKARENARIRSGMRR
jgi:hypothetical protein